MSITKHLFAEGDAPQVISLPAAFVTQGGEFWEIDGERYLVLPEVVLVASTKRTGWLFRGIDPDGASCLIAPSALMQRGQCLGPVPVQTTPSPFDHPPIATATDMER